MPNESDLKAEIGHVLFLDIVGYSKRLITEQSALLATLNQIVRESGPVQVAQDAGNLIRLPTGDGMALVFHSHLELAVEGALAISAALRQHPELALRMGIHSGPINRVLDVNDRANVAGAGIDLAQRIMDCGDAGHILLSKRAADDLAPYPRWHPHLHDLGVREVKHGVQVHLFNFYDGARGNPARPSKFKEQVSASPAASVWRRTFFVALVFLFLAGAAWWSATRQTKSASQPTLTAPATPEKSIAVLPFENLSAEKENAFFADGIQNEILTNLARIADLKVISRTSVMQYRGTARDLREIGRQLGVANVLEGSVQRVAGKVRINAQLINARTDAHLWAQSYDRDLADVFAIQSEIAEAIVEQLHAGLSTHEKSSIEKPPTTDLAAYELYLRAQALYAETSDQLRAAEKLPEAARLLDQAVARDPGFLLAWCRLSRVHSLIYWQGHDHTPARLALAYAAVQKALRLQPEAGEAHLALAAYYYHGFRDYERAQSELAIARQTLPNNAEVYEYTGYINRRQGHWKEATRNLERALESDPRNFFILQQMALTYEAQHRYADQIQIYSRALTVVPGDPATRIYRAEAELEWRADITPFQKTLAILLAEDPRYALCERTAAAMTRALTNYPPDGLVSNGVKVPRSYWEGVAARLRGDSAGAKAAFTAARAEVAQILQSEPDFAPALSLLGVIDAGLGHKEQALAEGRRASELLPISKDAIDGVALAVNLAQIYAWTDEKVLALEQIAAVEQVPNYLSYGFLKLQPFWDSLRGEPRFEKIVASLAP